MAAQTEPTVRPTLDLKAPSAPMPPNPLTDALGSSRAFAIAASMFMNSNSLPIALMQSMVLTVHGLKWGPGDTRDGMLGRALTYLVLYSTLGLMVRVHF